MSYKEIKVSEGAVPASIIDVEDVTLEDSIPTDDNNASDKEEGSVEINLTTGKEEKEEEKEEVAEEVKEEAPKKAPVVKEDKKPSRAQKRIKQLHTEKTDLQFKLEQAEQEKIDLQRKLVAGTKESKETVKSTLETSLINLTGSLKDAIESGDSSEVVRLQDEMMTAKMQLAGVTSELTNFKDIPDAAPAPKQNTQQGPSEKALDWIEEHPTFKTDELFYVSAMTVNNSLVKEGYDPESEDFYSELNSRLSTRFPEAFGIDEENSVEYSKDENSSKEPDVKQSKASSKQTQEQTMSGASRSPAGKANKPRGNDSVVLSPQMVKQADRWGITLEQMARRVAHSQKNSIGDGYVPILIDKK